jgi:hypothetical protein
MSKLWEAIKDLEREREQSGEDGATPEGSRQVVATYIEGIRHRMRDPAAEPPALASDGRKAEIAE